MTTFPTRSGPTHEPWLLLALCAVCVIAYAGGLFGDFLFDDFTNIVNNPALRALTTATHHWLFVALSSGSGILRRPISMLSFGLNVAWFGMNPVAFKLVNLGIHLANGALIYAIGRRLAGRLLGSGGASLAVKPETLALIAAGWWLLHPLNVSGVVYIVQRMNELAVLFTLCGLLCYVDGRERALRGESALASALAGLCLFGLLAVFSKENGALIAAYALVIEATCFRFEAVQPTQRRVIKAFFWFSVALPVALSAIYLAMHPQWLTDSYAGRDFTLSERLLSEARILCDYLLWIFVPNPAWMGIFHDDIATSTGLFSPISTVFAIAFLAALVVAAWKLCRRSPGFGFAVAWFLVGHAMESTILPLELVFEHRNYLPMAGLLLGTVCALAPLLPARWPARTVGLGCAALLLGLAGITAVRAASWGSPLRLALDDVAHHPMSPRAQYQAGREIIIAGAAKGKQEKAEQEAVPYLERSVALDQQQVSAAVALMLIRASAGAVQESAVSDLAGRLRHTRANVQANPFLDMLVAATQRKLSLTPKDMSVLVEAALANPLFRPQVRAMILNNYGAYQFDVAHDNQSAVSLTMAATAEDPQNPYFEMNLTKIALALGQTDIARQHLEAAKLLNKVGIYDQDIGNLQQQLAQ